MKKLIFINPCREGGNDKITYYGVKEFISLYLKNKKYIVSPSCLDSNLKKEFGIIGYDIIKKQMNRAF